MTLLEGYIALWRKYPEDEIKVRVARPHVLSPSKSLLHDWKSGHMTWEHYEKRFREEILSNPEAVAELEELAELSTKLNVRLLCYEKNPPCHRFILIEMIEGMKEGWLQLRYRQKYHYFNLQGSLCGRYGPQDCTSDFSPDVDNLKESIICQKCRDLKTSLLKDQST